MSDTQNITMTTRLGAHQTGRINDLLANGWKMIGRQQPEPSDLYVILGWSLECEKAYVPEWLADEFAKHVKDEASHQRFIESIRECQEATRTPNPLKAAIAANSPAVYRMHRAIGILELVIFRHDPSKVGDPVMLIENLREAIGLWRQEGLSDADARNYIVGEFEKMSDVKDLPEPVSRTI